MVVLTIVTKKNGETFFFDEPFPKVHFMKLVSCSLYNSWYNLSTDGIIRAKFKEREFNFLTVPAGHHTYETLVNYFNQDKDNAESSAYTINGGIYFVSKNHDVSFVNGFDGLFSSATTKYQKTWFFAGLKKTTYFIHCDLIDKKQNYFNTQRSDLLAKFDVRGKAYEKVTYDASPQQPLRDCSTDSHVKSFTLSVRDQDGLLFDLNGLPLEFVLEIK